MTKTKNLLLDLSGHGEFCSDSQELADNFVILYRSNESVRKSVDIFLNEFNKDKEEIISLKDIFDVYNGKNNDTSKIVLVKKFFEEYFTNYNVGITFNGEEHIGPDGDINIVKKTVLQVITSEKRDIDEIHMLVYAIKLFLIEMTHKIDEILSNQAKEFIGIYDFESMEFFKELFDIIKKLDKSKHKFILLALLQQGRIIKPTIDRRDQPIGQNIIELFETIQEISVNKKRLLEKNLNKVMFENGALSKRNRVLITKLLFINQDKIDAKKFLKFKDKKKVKIKQIAGTIKQRKKGLLDNINKEEFLLFVQKEIEKNRRENEINANNYFFAGKQINKDFSAQISFKLKISKKKKNILSMISQEELNEYILMYISGYKS